MCSLKYLCAPECKLVCAFKYLCAPDDRAAPVGGEDDDGRDGGLERSVQVGKALDVQHVNLDSPKSIDWLIDIGLFYLVYITC